MLRATAFLCLAAGVSAFPIELPFTSSACTGAGAPSKDPPTCYAGKASILGGAFSESVKVTIKTWDGSSKGTMDIVATGASPEQCGDLGFTKSGQDISIPNAKSCLSGTSVTAKYCSDQDEIVLHVAIPHLPVASLPVSLKPVAC